MQQINSLNMYVMSDDTALGFFDADGSVLISTDYRSYESGKTGLSYKVVYFLGQSLSKKDAVENFAQKFGGKTLVDNESSEFRVNQTSQVGERVCQFFLNNNPKHPYRLRDWLISEQVVVLLKAKQNKVSKITIAHLARHKSLFVIQGGGDKFFKKCYTHIQATRAEIRQGIAASENMIAEIEKNIAAYTKKLATIKLSDDYVLGAHYGDGSFYVSLSWKPTLKKAHRLRCEPKWAISGDDETYCQAFANRFNGRTSIVDKKGQRQFGLVAVKKCVLVLDLFDKAPWMTAYKLDQYNRWKQSIYLIRDQQHLTEQGIRKLLDLTYGLAEKGTRAYSKQQYLEWGLAWLNNPNRQKRKPRGLKKSVDQ